jgi:molecular chaperone DnaK (HSP70)
MNKKSAKYHIGIDLGTTHTVVAYAETHKKTAEIHIFEIEQLVAPGEVSSLKLLPSVRYHPATGELSAADMAFSPSGDQAIIGQAARALSAKTQGRFISSAKSWLSHPSIDHTAAILPWGSHDDVYKVSPLEASASYLQHVRQVWNHKNPNALFEEQNIVITVPASFDDSARSLTIEAARLAGLQHARLLEEPQAVCYDWLHRHADTLENTLKNIKLLLVCDVGGGTTDLTLIKVDHSQKEPKLSRIAVGEHLMLGGDNIDLTLAHLAESRISTENKKLSSADLSYLLEQCRIVKEQLLADNAPEFLSVTLLGGGSKLIGGARSAQFTRDEVHAIALDGFFPLSKIDELPNKKRSGVVEFGLPYAAEAAVSKHIAAFLKTHQQTIKSALGEASIPDALLLNGGVFRSPKITQRTIDLLESWQSQAPLLLENQHPELSVAYGAVSYGLAREHKNINIGGGASRSYFLLIGSEEKQQSICILPRGSEENNEIILKDRQFSLRLGQPVSFHLVSLTGGKDYQVGEIVTLNDDFHPLPPLAVAFEHEDYAQNTEVEVQLSATLSEVGTLQIQCISTEEKSRRWNVQFQIRKATKATLAQKLPDNFLLAIEKIEAIFGSKSKEINPKAVKSLRVDLEKLLGLRSTWSSLILRELFSALLEVRKNHRRSPNHERVWLSLIGYCLRPGFGYQLDNWRVEQLWKAYNNKIQFVNETQNWSEWWTLWRRISGGLDTESQELIFDDIEKYINPASARQGTVAKQGKQKSYDDMVRLAAVLERLPINKKEQLGEWLLKRLQKSSEPAQSWWAVGRIGARVPFHASTHFVVPPATAELWLQQLLTVDWKKIPQAAFAATLIARMSGDRANDIDTELRQQILDKLKASKNPESWLSLVESVKELDAAEEKQIFGEALPAGLSLINHS